MIKSNHLMIEKVSYGCKKSLILFPSVEIYSIDAGLWKTYYLGFGFLTHIITFKFRRYTK